MPSRFREEPFNIDNYLSEVKAGRAGEDARAQTVARSSNHRGRQDGIRALDQQASQQQASRNDMERQQQAAMRDQESAARDNAKILNDSARLQAKAADDQRKRNVRAGAAAGMKTETDIETGKRSIQTHADGAPVFEAKAIGTPQEVGTAATSLTTPDGKRVTPGASNIMLGGGGADGALGAGFGESRSVFRQPIRDDRGQVTMQEPDAKTQSTTGLQYVTETDPQTGRSAKRAVGVDEEAYAKVQKAKEIEMREQQIDARKNAVDTAKFRFDPQFKPVNDEWEASKKEVEALPPVFVGKNGVWKYTDPKTSKEVVTYDPKEVQRNKDLRRKAEERQARAKEPYDRMAPAAANFERNEREIAEEKLKLGGDKVRNEMGLPDDDGGAADILAKATGAIPTTKAEADISKALGGWNADQPETGGMPATTGENTGPQYGNRPDGTPKGTGYLGELKLPDGNVATEYSTQSDAVKVNGQRVDFPTLVPTLSPEEVTQMTQDIIPNGKPIPEAIMRKAIDHANGRAKEGKSLFAEGEQEAPRPLITPDTDIQAVQSGLGTLRGLEEVSVQTTKNGANSLWKNGRLIAGIYPSGGVPIVVLQDGARTDTDVQKLVNLGETKGAPLYMRESTNRQLITKEAEGVAAIFSAVKDPLLYSPEGKPLPALGKRLEELGATPEAIMRRVDAGEISVQHGQAILKDLYGRSMEASDPTDPKVFEKWISETTQRENKDLRELYGNQKLNKTDSVGARMEEATTGIKDFGTQDAIKSQFLIEKFQENHGKPNEPFSKYYNLQRGVNSKEGAGTGNILGSWAGFAGKTITNDVLGSMLGLATGLTVQGGAGVMSLLGDEQAGATNAEMTELRNRSWVNFTQGVSRNAVKWGTADGRAKMKAFDQSFGEFSQIIVEEMDKPVGERDQNRIQGAKKGMQESALALHNLSQDEDWPVTADNLDPDKDPALQVALARFAATADPSQLEAMRNRLLLDNGGRQLAGKLEKKIKSDGFWGAVEGGTYAGWQEIGTELLADAAVVVTGGGSKLLQGGLKTAGAIAKAKRIENAVSAIGKGIDKFNDFGIKKATLAQGLSAMDKAGNMAKGIAKTVIVGGGGEGLEEVIVEAGESDPNLGYAFGVGLLGGVALTPVFYPVQKGIQAGQERQEVAKQAAQNATYAKNFNEANRGTAGHVDLTPETAATARAFVNSADFTARNEAIANIQAMLADTGATGASESTRAKLDAQLQPLIAEQAVADVNAIEAAREIAAMPDETQRVFHSGIAKVATGNTASLTTAERTAITGAITASGNPYFATVEGKGEFLTDEARAELLNNSPALGSLIQTTESQAIYLAQSEAANATAQPAAPAQEAQPISQTGEEASGAQGDPATGGVVPPHVSAAAGLGNPSQANAPAMADAAIYETARQDNPALPEIPVVVQQAFDSGQPVSASMVNAANAAGIEIPDGYQKQGAAWVNPNTAAPTAKQQAAPAQTNSNASLSGWQAQWKLAQTARESGVDLTTMSREEYADYAISQGLRIDDSQMRMLPGLRSAESMEDFLKQKKAKSATTPEQIQQDLKFANFAEEQKALAEQRESGQSSGEVSTGVTIRSGTAKSNSWLYWKINKGATSAASEVHKSYIGFKDIYKSMTPARTKAFMAHLQSKGFNGDLKTVQDLSTQSGISDQIVMHGATQADAQLALEEAKAFFGDEVGFSDSGVDLDGKSHSQVLAAKIAAGIAAQAQPAPAQAQTGNPADTGIPAQSAPAAAAKAKTPAQAVAEKVKANVEKAMPALKGRIEIVESAMDGNGKSLGQTGGAYADESGKIFISVSDIAREAKNSGNPDATAQAIENIIVRHEAVHVVQYEAVRRLWKESESDASFNAFFTEWYGKIASEISPEAIAAARDIYGTEAWDAIKSPSLQAAELVRMLVEAKVNPESAEKFSELYRAVLTSNSPTLIDMLRKAVEILSEMIRTGKLPESARIHVDAVEALYRDMLGETASEYTLTEENGKGVIRMGEEVIFSGTPEKGAEYLKKLEAAPTSPLVIFTKAMRKILGESKNLTDAQSLELGDILTELAATYEGMAPEEMRETFEREIREWADDQQTATEEAAPKTPKQRNTETAAQAKAEKLINSGNFPAINAILASGGKITPRPNRIALILSRKRQGKKLNEAEMRLLRNDAEYDGALTQAMYGRAGDGMVAREVLKKLIARQGEGMSPDEMSGYLGTGKTASDLWEQLYKELRAISNGTALEGDKADPNRERTDAEIAEEEVEADAARFKAAALPQTAEEIQGQSAEEYGEDSNIAKRAGIFVTYAERFSERDLGYFNNFVLEEMEMIRQGVIDPKKWVAGSTVWDEATGERFVKFASLSNKQLETWAEAREVFEEYPTYLLSSSSPATAAQEEEIERNVVQARQTVDAMPPASVKRAGTFWLQQRERAGITRLPSNLTGKTIGEIAAHFKDSADLKIGDGWPAYVKGETGIGHILQKGQYVWVDVSKASGAEAYKDPSKTKKAAIAPIVYQIAQAYAKNNGMKFGQDPAGVSAIAKFRRWPQMLSAAVRSGSTSHLDGSDDVNRWTNGADPAMDAGLLALHEMAYVESLIPEIKSLYLSEDLSQFLDESGSPISDKALENIVSRGRDRGALGIGEATLRRALLTLHHSAERGRLVSGENKSNEVSKLGILPRGSEYLVLDSGRSEKRIDNRHPLAQALYSSPSQGSMDFGATGEMGDRTQRGLNFDSLPEVGDKAKFQENAQKALDNAPSDKAQEAIASRIAAREGISNPAPFIKAAIGGQAAFDFGTSGSFATRGGQMGMDFAGDVKKSPETLIPNETIKGNGEKLSKSPEVTEKPISGVNSVESKKASTQINLPDSIAKRITDFSATIPLTTDTQADTKPAEKPASPATTAETGDISGDIAPAVRPAPNTPEFNLLPKEDKKEIVLTKAAQAELKRSGIQDFGEQMAGARKNAQTSASRDISDDDLATLPFAKIWPKAEVDAIEDTDMAALAHALRSVIPTKPRVSYKLDRWLKQVKQAREFMRIAEMAGMEKVGAAMKEKYVFLQMTAHIGLLQNIPRAEWDRVTDVANYPDAMRYSKEGEKIPAAYAQAKVDDTRIIADDMAILAEKVNAKLAEGKAQPPKMQFEVRQRQSGGDAWINKKGDPLRRKLKTFPDFKEALQYVRDNNADLVAAWEKVKDSDNVKESDVRGEENRPRSAKDHRKGRDATPEMFEDAFGFRGVEWGNWVSQGKNAKERQGMLNAAYDALLDLADIVGVPPKAISLNGELGMAFGSRGSGSASAHYETGNIVINLTKTRGAGTLAHEWFHALDHYFSRQRGGERKFISQEQYRDDNYITHKPEPLYVHKAHGGAGMTRAALDFRQKTNPESGYFEEANWMLDPKHPEGVRPEVERRFAALVHALVSSPMAARAMKIDKGKSGGYWSRTLELAARSFENYTIGKMMQEGYHNDYLANVVSFDDFGRDEGRYPYLLADELPPIAEAFGDLFSTIQTEETETGVRLFSSPSNATGANGRPAIQSTDGMTLEAPGNALLSSPAYHGTPHKVDRFSTDKIGTGEGAQAYGWGLYFAENEEVAKDYRKQLSRGVREATYRGVRAKASEYLGHTPEQYAVHRVATVGKEEALREISEDIKNYGSTDEQDRRLAFTKEIDPTEISIEEGGNLYTVTLNVEDNELLDWDKPIREQSVLIRQAFRLWLGNDIEAWEALLDQKASEWYGGQWGDSKAAKRRSEFLHGIGIKGIRYLDGNSRYIAPHYLEYRTRKEAQGASETLAGKGYQNPRITMDGFKGNPWTLRMDAPQGSYNYVIFDGNDIEITEENGRPANATALFSSASRRDTQTPDLFSAATAPDAREKLGDVKVGTMSALGAYRTLTAKREKTQLTPKEEQQLLDAEQALGQKLAFDMEAVKQSVEPKNGKNPLDSTAPIIASLKAEIKRGIEIYGDLNKSRSSNAIQETAWKLMGDRNKAERMEAMAFLTGKKATVTGSGVTNLTEALKEWIRKNGISEETLEWKPAPTVKDSLTVQTGLKPTRPQADIDTSAGLFGADNSFKATKDGQMTLFSSPSADRAFFSKLEEVIAAKVSNNSTPVQIMATIDPTKGSGVKAEEIKWSGIAQAVESIAAENGGKVPKQALLDHLSNEGSVRFEEVKNESEPIFSDDNVMLYDGDQAETFTREDAIEYLEEEAEKIRDGWRDEVSDEPIPIDEDGDETTEDSEDYPVAEWKVNLTGNHTEYFKTKEEANSRLQEENEWIDNDSATVDTDSLTLSDPNNDIITMSENGSNPGSVKYPQYVLPGGEDYREVVLAMPTKLKDPKFERVYIKDNGDYRVEFDDGQYIDVKGWVANNEDQARTTAESTIKRKVAENNYTSSHFPDVPNYVAHMRTNERDGGLFIEEIQSDRFQQARKVGFKGDASTESTMWKLFDEQGNRLGSARGASEADAIAKSDSRATRAEIIEDDRIAPAPYATTWPLAMFKRALRDAVAGGKSWIGWTTGETQNDRFDLSKQVDELSIDRMDNGKFNVDMKPKGSREWQQAGRGIDESKLADTIGKDLAEKVIASPESRTQLKGDQLKVESAGMKGFYDNILPKEVQKYVKQWGGKVEAATLETNASKQVFRETEDGSNGWSDQATTTGGTPIWRVTITPEMRESVASRGQALFSSPAPEGKDNDSAIQAALDSLSPMHRKVFDAVKGGKTPAEVMERYKIPARAVENILNQVRSRITAAMQAEKPFGLEPRTVGGKISGGGRPDLALGAKPAVAAIDQIRNESGIPDVRGWAEVNAEADKMLQEDYTGTYDALLNKARTLQPMTDVEVSASKRIIAKETMEGRIQTADERVKIAMMIHGYRDIGTETARSLAIRRDPDMNPAQRHAQFIAEALFSPDPNTRARLRKASPKDQKAILEGWMVKVDKIKEELRARGYDLDASLAAFNARQEEIKESLADNPQAAKILDDTFRRLSPQEKVIVQAINDGATYQGAAVLSGESMQEAKAVYFRYAEEVYAAMEEAGKRYASMALASSPSNARRAMMLEAIGMRDPDLVPDNEADKPRVEAIKKQREATTGKPRKAKPATAAAETPEKRETKAAAEKILGIPADKPLTPAQIAAAERFANAEPSTWKVIRQETSKLFPESEGFPENYEQGGNARRIVSSILFPEPINETTGTFDLNDPYAVKEVMNAFALARGTKMDALMEYWRMSILTGPQTHLVNTGSNVMNAAYNLLPRRAVEAGANTVLSAIGLGSKEAATFGEFSAMSKNLRAAIQLGARQLLTSWKLETRLFDEYASGEPVQLDFTGVGGETYAPALGGKLGKVMRSLSFRAMTAADEGIKHFYAQLETAAHAHRIAKVEEKLSGAAYEARIADLMKPGSKAWLRSIDGTKRITFQEELDGTDPRLIRRIDQLAELAQKGRAMPWLGRPLTFFIPFIQTPSNIAKEAIEMSPLGGFLAVVDGIRALKRRYARGSLTKAEAEAEAAKLYDRARLVRDVTNQTIAWVAYFAIAGLVEPDDDDEDGRPFITGTTPYKTTQKGERDNAYSVMPPQSIRIGNTIVSYQRIEPFATMLAGIADLIQEIDRNGGTLNGAAASAYASRLKDQFADKTFLHGVSNIVKAIEDPDRFMERSVSDIATGFVPNIIRQPVREADKNIRDTSPRADDGFFEGISRRVGYSLVPQAAPIKQDVWGNDITQNRGKDLLGLPAAEAIKRVLDPLNSSIGANADPLDAWIFQYNRETADSTERIAIQPIPNYITATVNGKRVKIALSIEERREANRNAGKAAREVFGDDWDWKEATKPGAMERAKFIEETYKEIKAAQTKELRAKKLAEGLATE